MGWCRCGTVTAWEGDLVAGGALVMGMNEDEGVGIKAEGALHMLYIL